MTDCKWLGQVDLFQGLQSHEIEEIVKLCRASEYEKDSMIFKEGEKADSLYTLVKGSVALRFKFPSFKRRFFFMTKDSTSEITVTIVPAGRAFGWSALVEPYKYTLSAYCVEPCEILTIEGQKLLELCQGSTKIGFHVMSNLAKIIGERLQSHREQIKNELEQYSATKY